MDGREREQVRITNRRYRLAYQNINESMMHKNRSTLGTVFSGEHRATLASLGKL